MQLVIRHLTTYRYSRPVAYEIESLRLTPRVSDGQAIIEWQVRGEKSRPLPSYLDGMGNLVHVHTIARAHTVATVSAAGIVETRALGGLVRDPREPLPPGYFLRATPLTRPDAAIADFAAQWMKGENPRERLTRLMEGVGGRIAYRPGLTHAATSAAEALGIGAGVCQDHAHLFIAACRASGIPARYVGGYFWTGGEGAEEQASHAWAEAFLDEVGWMGFDPANRTLPGERHVRVGVGLDYRAAAPVRGVRRGEAEEVLSVALEIAAGEAAQ